MTEKILVPLDGSKVGEAALPIVEKLVGEMAPETKVEITLLIVITSLTHWVVVGEASAPISYTEEELKAIEQKVSNYLQQVSQDLKARGINSSIMVRTGAAHEEIMKAAEELGVDMIAMSTHGRSGLKKLAFGSVTDKVLRVTSVPVLLVRAPADTVNT